MFSNFIYFSNNFSWICGNTSESSKKNDHAKVEPKKDKQFKDIFYGFCITLVYFILVFHCVGHTRYFSSIAVVSVLNKNLVISVKLLIATCYYHWLNIF